MNHVVLGGTLQQTVQMVQGLQGQSLFAILVWIDSRDRKFRCCLKTSAKHRHGAKNPIGVLDWLAGPRQPRFTCNWPRRHRPMSGRRRHLGLEVSRARSQIIRPHFRVNRLEAVGRIPLGINVNVVTGIHQPGDLAHDERLGDGRKSVKKKRDAHHIAYTA